jgi:hypothetical protein
MSLFQSLEIDSLKVRNLITRTSDNRAYPSDFTLYAKGDGGTYWSTGVTARQFIDLSTTTSSLISTVDGNNYVGTSTLSGTVVAQRNYIISTLAGISSFTQNLSSYSAAVFYVNGVVSSYSTSMGTFVDVTYTPLASTYIISTSLNLSMISTSIAEQAYLQSLSTTASTNRGQLQNLSTYTQNTYRAQSTAVGSTFGSVFRGLSTVYGSSVTYTNNRILFTAQQLTDLSTTVGIGFNITDTYPLQMANTASTLSTAITLGDYSTLVSANTFSSRNLSTLLSTVNLLISTSQSTLSSRIASSQLALVSSIQSTNAYVLATLNIVSTNNSQQLSSINGNISTIITTGLVDTLYQQFIQLQDYSAYLITSTLYTANNGFNSTVTTYTYIYNSTLNYINASTFNWLIDNAYFSSVSILQPLVVSTMDNVISTQIIRFDSTITGETEYFTSTISSYIDNLNTQLSSFVSTTEVNVSTINGEGLSTQMALYSTTIEAASSFIANASASSLTATSTILGYQLMTAPSIILNSIDNISTLSNVSTITGLPSLQAGIAELDVSLYNNFYILVSDISSDVFYGLVYKTDWSTVNRDINIYIDIQSSYSNKFFTLDTDNLSTWLSTPKIYNPGSFNLVTAEHITNVPNTDSIGQIYLSTFIGAYMISLRLLPDAMYLKSVYTYPYIYSNLNILSFITPVNVKVSNPLLNQSSFTYRGGSMPVTWETNDPNIPLGFRFVGKDAAGNTVSKWAGPYNSGAGRADVIIPGGLSPFISYNTMFLSVYPNKVDQSGTTDGNINTPSMTFAQHALPPLVVVNPSLNSRIKVYNPGTNPRYLQVAEIWVNNEKRQNTVAGRYARQYARFISTASIPYNTDLDSFGPQKAFDGNLTTYFAGGLTPTQTDPNAYIQATASSFTRGTTSTTLISSIEIYAGPITDGLEGMSFDLYNWNEPGVPNGLFYSTMALSSYKVNVLSFNGVDG